MKNKTTARLIGLTCALLTGCTLGPNIMPDMRPEIIVYSASQTTVKNAIIQVCDARSLRIENTGDSSVTCGRAAGMGAQFALGTKGGSEVQYLIKFNYFPVDGKAIKVSASAWNESQSFYGRMDRTYLTDQRAVSDMMSYLQEIKNKVSKK